MSKKGIISIFQGDFFTTENTEKKIRKLRVLCGENDRRQNVYPLLIEKIQRKL